ncbi:MAG: YjbQ family protein [Nitrospinae bacterium]|nr:YjbQ family protein [Nitrospinota bacterium]
MTVKNSIFNIKTKGDTDIIDITSKVADEVERSNISDGIALLFVSGSTAGITTIEYETGVLNDLKKAIERIAPRDIYYEHDRRWGDGNGFAHVRAALLGASFSVPFKQKKLLLGTWQQIVLICFDNRPRSRDILVQIVGD